MTRPFQSAYSSAERDERSYIEACGECGVETIVDMWMDSTPKLRADVKTKLQDRLRSALRGVLTDLETAEWAAILCGNPDLETWLGDQG